jgi:hypothetical protein
MYKLIVKRKFAQVMVSLVFSSLMFTSLARAANNAQVTATVTVQEIAVSVSDGSIAYGTVATSGTQSTLAAGVNDMQTITNDGNVSQDFDIKGSNSANWTLSGTQGENQYFHKFCNDTDLDCSNTSSNYTALTTSDQAIDTSIAADGTVNFQLYLGVPSSTTYYTQQNVNVTITASAS